VLLVHLLPTLGRWKGPIGAASALSWAQSENWFWGFQLQWLGVQAAGLGAILCAVRLTENDKRADDEERIGRLKYTLMLVSCCLVSVLLVSHGTAMVIGASSVFLVRRSWKEGLALMLGASIFAIVLSTPDGLGPQSLRKSLQIGFGLLAGAFKIPVGLLRRGLPGGSVVLIVIGALIFFGAVWIVWNSRNRLAANAGAIGILVAVAVFVAMVAVGRADFGMVAAVQSRYVTVTILLIPVLAALLMDRFVQQRERIAKIFFVVLCLGSLAAVPSFFGQRRDKAAYRRCLLAFVASQAAHESHRESSQKPVCTLPGVSPDRDVAAEMRLLKNDET
jgi:hypothetical protein